MGAQDEQEDEDERSVSSHVELCCGMGPPTVKLVTHVANNSRFSKSFCRYTSCAYDYCSLVQCCFRICSRGQVSTRSSVYHIHMYVQCNSHACAKRATQVKLNMFPGRSYQANIHVC